MAYDCIMRTVRNRLSRLSAAVMLVALAINIIAPLAGMAEAYGATQNQSESDGVLYVCTQNGFVAITDTADGERAPKKINNWHCILCVVGGGALLTPTAPALASIVPIDQRQNTPASDAAAMIPKNHRGINPSRAPPFIV